MYVCRKRDQNGHNTGPCIHKRETHAYIHPIPLGYACGKRDLHLAHVYAVYAVYAVYDPIGVCMRQKRLTPCTRKIQIGGNRDLYIATTTKKKQLFLHVVS